jgi:hypothetical protein
MYIYYCGPVLDFLWLVDLVLVPFFQMQIKSTRGSLVNTSSTPSAIQKLFFSKKFGLIPVPHLKKLRIQVYVHLFFTKINSGSSSKNSDPVRIRFLLTGSGTNWYVHYLSTGCRWYLARKMARNWLDEHELFPSEASVDLG